MFKRVYSSSSDNVSTEREDFETFLFVTYGLNRSADQSVCCECGTISTYSVTHNNTELFQT